MAEDSIKIDAGDVRVVEMDYEVCNECPKPATKIIMIDFRNADSDIWFGGRSYCAECAEIVAARIREALPEEVKE